jgi:hypothetical protein
MTRTSEGPAGMSIETIASLFCGQIRMRTTKTNMHNEDAERQMMVMLHIERAE